MIIDNNLYDHNDYYLGILYAWLCWVGSTKPY